MLRHKILWESLMTRRASTVDHRRDAVFSYAFVPISLGKTRPARQR